MEFLLEPLKYEFFRHGLWAALMVGALCGVVGVYIVLRGMSYIGHGLSHAAFGGAVVGYVMNVNFYVGAGLWGFLAAILIGQVSKRKKIKEDAAIGIVTTASFAIGVALISRVRKFTLSFEAALFGNILGITTSDLVVISVVTGAVSLLLFLLYKQLLFTTFDRDAAKVFGIPTDKVEILFSLILASAIIVSMNIIGVTMIAAAIVIPAVTARMLTDRFSRMMIISTLIGSSTAVAGMYLSYYFNAASGATIVLFAAAVFCTAMLYNYVRKRMLVHEHAHRHGAVEHLHEHPQAAVHEHPNRKEAENQVSTADIPKGTVAKRSGE
jgi:manganese/iron transport system permease protein/iron/zinc/copper transport system permease protein